LPSSPAAEASAAEEEAVEEEEVLLDDATVVSHWCASYTTEGRPWISAGAAWHGEAKETQ
jgi:hypothetical protein